MAGAGQGESGELTPKVASGKAMAVGNGRAWEGACRSMA
jgi:hypothetical protein